MLEIRDAACERGGRVLFRGLQCRVQGGQLLRVLGANGSGKTSLLRMVCGLLPPAEGQVLWQGESTAALGEDFSRQLVYLGHAAAIKDDLSARENLQLACQFGGTAVSTAQTAQALQAAGLAGRDRVPCRYLSQGQRRRVALARLVVACSAALWVLDEPFNALDTAATAWLGGLVTAHLARGGVVVLTSHQPVALDGADRQVEVRL